MEIPSLGCQDYGSNQMEKEQQRYKPTSQFLCDKSISFTYVFLFHILAKGVIQKYDVLK